MLSGIGFSVRLISTSELWCRQIKVSTELWRKIIFFRVTTIIILKSCLILIWLIVRELSKTYIWLFIWFFCESAIKRLKLAARYFQTEREAKAPYKAGRDDGDIREVTVGRENNRERVKESDTRQVVVFNKDHWVETVD